MTNKPMLSVERELLGRIARPQLKPRDETVRRRAITELRALLDKPAEAIPDKTVDAFSAWYSKNHYEGMSRATVGLMAFKAGAAYAEPAAHHQGEPVACVIAFREVVKEPELLSWNQLPAGEHRLYAEPPSPVAVVMPEHTMRSVMDAIQQARGFPVLTSNQCHALAESLNYVARLNGVKP